MATLDGKTPEQIAKDIIDAATQATVIEISGVAAQALEQVMRYKYAKKIYSKGEKWFKANLENLQTEFIEKVIEAQYDQRKKLDSKQEEAEKHEYVAILVSRGVNRFKAMEMAGLISAEDFEANKKLEEEAAKKAAEAKASKK